MGNRQRYCCQVLKEATCRDRFITTGVRWAESVKRRNNRGVYENFTANPEKKIILNNDNDENRRLFESCALKGKKICNPIVDWTDRDVWDYIRSERLPMNPLYEMGFYRVGCIGCPMAGKTPPHPGGDETIPAGGLLQYLTAVPLQPGGWELLQRDQGPHGDPPSFIHRIVYFAGHSLLLQSPEGFPHIVDGLGRIRRGQVVLHLIGDAGPPYDLPTHAAVLPSAVRDHQGASIQGEGHLGRRPHPLDRFLL